MVDASFADAGREARAFVGPVFASEPTALAIAIVDGGPCVVVDVDGQRSVIDASGAVRRVPRTPGLLAVQGVGRDLVALSFDHGSLVAETLDHTGRRADVATLDDLASFRRASTDDSVFLAWAARSGPASLERFTVGPGAITHRSLVVDRARDERAREIAGLAAAGEGFAVVYRRGVPEDDRGAVVLATERGVFEVESLHDLGMLERLETAGESVALVGSFEFDRPRAFLFDRKGRTRDIRRLAPGDRPSFVTVADRAEIEGEGSNVRFRVRDVSGDAVMERSFARDGGRVPPTVARAPDGFVVAFVEHRDNGWGVRIIRIRQGDRG